MSTLPVMDLSSRDDEVAAGIGRACREHGFFYLVGHGIDEALGQRLEDLSPASSRCPKTRRRDTRWRSAGAPGAAGSRSAASSPPAGPTGRRACTSAPSCPTSIRACAPACRCTAATCFPATTCCRAFATAVLDYMARGHRARAPRHGTASRCSLGLPADYFARRYTADPLVLFRIFHYPSRPMPQGVDALRGVGEHTDYGLLTLLRQDDVGGLQVRTPRRLDRGAAAAGLLRLQHRRHARPHDGRPLPVHAAPRAHNTSGRDRLSFPLFFDPDFDARIEPLPHAPRPTTTPRAGTAPACTPSRAPTATTCSARSARSSRS